MQHVSIYIQTWRFADIIYYYNNDDDDDGWTLSISHSVLRKEEGGRTKTRARHAHAEFPLLYISLFSAGPPGLFRPFFIAPTATRIYYTRRRERQRYTRTHTHIYTQLSYLRPFPPFLAFVFQKKKKKYIAIVEADTSTKYDNESVLIVIFFRV